MKMKRILVIAVHPDDETLSCGGTLLKFKEEGAELSWLIVTNVHENKGWDSAFVEKRQVEIDEVSKLYGFENTYKLDYPTTELDQVHMNELVGRISEVINKLEPDTIILPNRSDVHSDHDVAFRAAYSCTKNFRYPFIKNIMMGETLSETEFAPSLSENAFVPNVFVDITKFFDQKLKIMAIYESEVMEEWQPRSLSSIESLARYRGSRIGKKYAEAFTLLVNIL